MQTPVTSYSPGSKQPRQGLHNLYSTLLSVLEAEMTFALGSPEGNLGSRLRFG